MSLTNCLTLLRCQSQILTFGLSTRINEKTIFNSIQFYRRRVCLVHQSLISHTKRVWETHLQRIYYLMPHTNLGSRWCFGLWRRSCYSCLRNAARLELFKTFWKNCPKTVKNDFTYAFWATLQNLHWRILCNGVRPFLTQSFRLKGTIFHVDVITYSYHKYRARWAGHQL